MLAMLAPQSKAERRKFVTCRPVGNQSAILPQGRHRAQAIPLHASEQCGISPARLFGSNFEFGETMLSHCANPRCARPFLRLGQGRLFLVETETAINPVDTTAPLSPYARRPPRHVDRYWLCERCAEISTLVHDRDRGIVLVPLPQPPLRARAEVAAEQFEIA